MKHFFLFASYNEKTPDKFRKEKGRTTYMYKKINWTKYSDRDIYNNPKKYYGDDQYIKNHQGKGTIKKTVVTST